MGNITQIELCFSRASFLLHFATSLSLLYILMGHRLYFPTKIIFISLNIALVLANSVGLCKTPHYMAFHLRLHCLATVYLNTTKTPKLRKDTQSRAKTRKGTQRHAKTYKDTQIFACLCPSLCVFVNFKRFFAAFACLCPSLPVFACLCVSLRSLGVFAVFR